MRITFVLKKVLEAHNGCKRGTITHICEHTNLKRHQVSDLINNRTKNIKPEILSEICRYLHKYCGIDWKQLPGLLFEFESTKFWSLLTERDVNMYVGVRTMKGQTETRWVNAYDTYLQSVLMQELFSMGHDKLSTLNPSMVRSAGKDNIIDEIKSETKEIYDGFKNENGNRALVCLGSIKSNPICERVIASVFDCEPFETKKVNSVKDRGCPFFFGYRQEDPHISSCHGGLHLTDRRTAIKPGIHFETAGGKWEYLPTTKSEDAALVLYANHPTKGVTEMILAGFSGRSTGCIALEFPRLANELWAGRYEQDDLKLGVFLLRFKFDRNAPQCPSGSRTIIEHSNCEVIALDKEVIRRRLKPLADTTNQSTPA